MAMQLSNDQRLARNELFIILRTLSGKSAIAAADAIDIPLIKLHAYERQGGKQFVLMDETVAKSIDIFKRWTTAMLKNEPEKMTQEVKMQLLRLEQRAGILLTETQVLSQDRHGDRCASSKPATLLGTKISVTEGDIREAVILLRAVKRLSLDEVAAELTTSKKSFTAFEKDPASTLPTDIMNKMPSALGYASEDAMLKDAKIYHDKLVKNAPSPKEISDAVRSLRKERGMSQSDLSKLTGLTLSMIIEIEKKPDAQQLKPYKLITLLKAFKCDSLRQMVDKAGAWKGHGADTAAHAPQSFAAKVRSGQQEKNSVVR